MRDTEDPGLRERLAEGARRYNEGAFWEAHEAWEEAWLALREEGREADARVVQALILASAAFENLDRGKPRGFAVQGAKALTRLREAPGRAEALGVANEAAFREGLTDAYLAGQRDRVEHLDELGVDPPRLTVRPADG